MAAVPNRRGKPEDDSIKIAIVGKPNAGKSSLLNKLVGRERAIVSPIPGTTRDAVDTRIEVDGLPVTLIDTAGIRRRGKIEQGVEKFSVLRSFKAIERSDVVLLIVDAQDGITAQDAHIAGFILEAWKSSVVLVNKWDVIEKDADTMDEYTRHVRRELNFMDYVPMLFISAKTGQRVDQVLPMALRVQEQRLARITTAMLNRVLRDAQDAHPAPSHAGRQLKIYYGSQVRVDPPTFVLHVNDPKLFHFSYMRYLENQFREAYGFHRHAHQDHRPRAQGRITFSSPSPFPWEGAKMKETATAGGLRNIYSLIELSGSILILRPQAQLTMWLIWITWTS